MNYICKTKSNILFIVFIIVDLNMLILIKCPINWFSDQQRKYVLFSYLFLEALRKYSVTETDLTTLQRMWDQHLLSLVDRGRSCLKLLLIRFILLISIGLNLNWMCIFLCRHGKSRRKIRRNSSQQRRNNNQCECFNFLCWMYTGIILISY